MALRLVVWTGACLLLLSSSGFVRSWFGTAGGVSATSSSGGGVLYRVPCTVYRAARAVLCSLCLQVCGCCVGSELARSPYCSWPSMALSTLQFHLPLRERTGVCGMECVALCMVGDVVMLDSSKSEG